MTRVCAQEKLVVTDLTLRRPFDSVNSLHYMQVHKRKSKLLFNAVAFVLKILAALVLLVGTVSFPSLLFASHNFRTFYWNLVGQNEQYAAVGAIAIFAFIIALASLFWSK